MSPQHVTKIDEESDPPIYQAACLCGWRGTRTSDRKHAVKEARMHRMKETVDAL